MGATLRWQVLTLRWRVLTRWWLDPQLSSGDCAGGVRACGDVDYPSRYCGSRLSYHYRHYHSRQSGSHARSSWSGRAQTAPCYISVACTARSWSIDPSNSRTAQSASRGSWRETGQYLRCWRCYGEDSRKYRRGFQWPARWATWVLQKNWRLPTFWILINLDCKHSREILEKRGHRGR